MKNFFGILIVMYGTALSMVFGVHTLVDYEALQGAVARGSERSEVRHRTNVGFEGVWFLMSNMMIIQGLSMASSRRKE
jgi:hypothetical protein